MGVGRVVVGACGVGRVVYTDYRTVPYCRMVDDLQYTENAALTSSVEKHSSGHLRRLRLGREVFCLWRALFLCAHTLTSYTVHAYMLAIVV